MFAVCDLPELDADVAAMSPDELADLLIAALNECDRTEFMRLSQRVARDAVFSIRCARLRPHRADMYSVGLLSLLQWFDKTIRQIQPSFWYFRNVARYSMFTWAFQQKIIRRRGAKHAETLLDADIAAGNDFDASFIQHAESRPECEFDIELDKRLFAAALDETDSKILHFLQDGVKRPEILKAVGLTNYMLHHRIAGIRDRIEGIPPRMARAYHEMGYSFETVASYLGTSLSRVRRECGYLTAKQRREKELRLAELNRIAAVRRRWNERCRRRLMVAFGIAV
jgi:hypothetical protein